MSDLIKCAKCGKNTNKFSPVCEHCSAPLKREEPAISEPENAAGKALHDELEKYAKRTKKCPFCAEEIHSDAIKCRFCGERITKSDGGLKKYTILLFMSLAVIAAALVSILAFTGGISSIGGFAGLRYDKGLSPELKKDRSKADYVKKYVTISDTGTIEETAPGSSAVTRYVYGTIKNAGDKTIIKLTITVYYFDKAGRCIAESTLSPILGTREKPNSIQPNSSKEYKLPIVNTDPAWSGRIREKVSDIEFL